LKRFGLKSAHSLLDDEGVKAMRDVLIRDVDFDPKAFAELLAEELEERIESIVEGIGYMNDTEDDAKIDEILQYSAFWRERGGDVAREYAERREPLGPAVDRAFVEWKENPGPKYTVPKLRRWKQHAAALRRNTTAPHVLSRYWSIQTMFVDLEDDVIQAVVKFDIEHGSRKQNDPAEAGSPCTPSVVTGFLKCACRIKLPSKDGRENVTSASSADHCKTAILGDIVPGGLD
jgi:hypothetical protein